MDGANSQEPGAGELGAQEPLKVVLVDQSHDAQDEARDLADARLDRELNEGGRFKRFVKGIWKGNIAKDFYRQKYIQQNLETMQQSDQVLIGESEDRRTQALQSTIERFQSECDDVIHQDAGERREVQAEQGELAQGVKQLIREFAAGRLTPEALREERTRLLDQYRQQHGEAALGAGVVTADNLLSVAQTVAGAVEHGESLDNVIQNLQVITGEARGGARTEARYNRTDRIIERLSHSKIGSLVTPETLTTSVTLALSLARLGGRSVVGAVTKTLVPGAAAGLWAGLRENRRVKDERAQHAREMATGAEFGEHDKRRNDMEATRYESIAAVDLTRQLQGVTDEERLRDGGNDALQAALDSLAAIQARVQLSDAKKADLISFSGKAEVGEERMMLDLARRQAKLAIETRLTPEACDALGILQGTSLEAALAARAGVVKEVLTGEMDVRDDAFKALKRRRVATAVAVGLATGIVGGLVVQEGIAAVDPTRFGLIDAMRGQTAVPLGDGHVHQTILEGMFRGNETTVHTGASSAYDTYSTAPHGSIEVSHDHTLVTNPNGTMDLVDPNGTHTVSGLQVDANGSFDQASLDKLHTAGMVVQDKSFDQQISTTTSAQVLVDQYIQNHSADTTHVTRELWYANNTPRVYDHNELRLYRGGSADAPGIINGGYQYTVAGMTPDGSWQGGESVDWNQAASNGNLFVAVSGTIDGQSTPFMIPIGPDGSINIPADSPAGHFFSNENNSVAFHGAYMEVVQTTDHDANGVVYIRPLATLVGDKSVHEVTDVISTTTTEHHADYVITTNGFDTVQTNFTEMAPVTPVVSRRSMEPLKNLARARREGRTYSESAYYRGSVGEIERQQILREVSPRLRDDPNARLNPGEELGWFEEELERRKGAAYVKGINEAIDHSPELSALSQKTGNIVVMPVAATNEADNIYNTLSLYAQQEADPDVITTILINLNWLDTARQDPAKVAEIQRTVSEIERARKAFPNLSVAVVQHEYDQAQVNQTGGVIGYVLEDLYNTALLAVQRRIKDGSIDSDHDVLIVRSDADVQGQARRQLVNLHRSMSESPDADILRGVTRFGVARQRRFPGFGVVSNFSAALSASDTQLGVVHTGGANFGVRASTLAAIGGLGEMLDQDGNKFTGAGSDDLAVGRRIIAARGIPEVVASQAGYYVPSSTAGSSGSGGPTVAGVKRIKLVGGATVDTNAERLLPFYLRGGSFQGAWGSGQDGFSGGPGGYRARTEDQDLTDAADREDYTSDQVYRAIEANITKELQWALPESGTRALALFGGSTPGTYVVTGDIGTDNVEFKLTQVGRDLLRRRIERGAAGRFDPYGNRKLRQLYGVVRPGAKRLPLAPLAPLVSPLG